MSAQKPPTREEEQELFKALPGSRNDIVLRYQYLIRGNLAPFSFSQHEDLVQEGTFGLISAIKTFDMERGFRFSTYGAFVIRRVMFEYVYKHRSTVRVPTGITKLMARIRRGLPLDGSEGEIKRAHAFLDRKVVQFPEHWEPEAEAEPELYDISESGVALHLLTDREFYLLDQHYYNGKMLKEVAAALGVSQARVGQIKKQALQKLRQGSRICDRDEKAQSRPQCV